MKRPKELEKVAEAFDKPKQNYHLICIGFYSEGADVTYPNNTLEGRKSLGMLNWHGQITILFFIPWFIEFILFL